MDFVWGGERKQINQTLVFSLNINNNCDKLVVCAVDFYSVFGDGNILSYGPSRTASGYVRKREINVKGVKELTIKVSSYGVECYAFDFQYPFFGAEAYSNEKLIYKTSDFLCYKEHKKIENMPKFSAQRGFIEGVDFTDERVENIHTYPVDSPYILSDGNDCCLYKIVKPISDRIEKFEGIKNYKAPYWEKSIKYKPFLTGFSIEDDFIAKTQTGYDCRFFSFDKEYTGFIEFFAETDEDTELFIIFEEYLENGEWNYSRCGCHQLIYARLKKGINKFFSAEPYALKYLKAIFKGNVKIEVQLTKYSNDFDRCVFVFGNDKFVKVFNAAENTFRQNAVDIFMDCPSRERAGWLCDSYFTAMSERLFTGKNDIEKNFLENFLIADTPELPKGMIPKCYPAEHTGGMYIPNWAMWFVIECAEYVNRTGENSFKEKCRDKIYGILHFFEKYINEFGLLENLESWVFVEWSDCNKKDYVSGVNFPSNILYAYALKKTAELFDDDELAKQADSVRKQIIQLSFNGDFFIDNAIRESGVLKLCESHITETCQYYALFTGICPNEAFKEKVIEYFGPKRTEAYPEISRSNVFIGNYLRLFWLCNEGLYDRAIDECLDYFSAMADKTGTLWEHDSPKASCNHGFASVVAVILLRCIAGYVTVEKGKVELTDSKSNNYKDVNVVFDYSERRGNYEKKI